MSDKQPAQKYDSTRDYLLARIEGFLSANSCIDAESLGWYAIGDSSLVGRLRNGGDVTTRKLDAILRFLSNPDKLIKEKKRWRQKKQATQATTR